MGGSPISSASGKDTLIAGSLTLTFRFPLKFSEGGLFRLVAKLVLSSALRILDPTIVESIEWLIVSSFHLFSSLIVYTDCTSLFGLLHYMSTLENYFSLPPLTEVSFSTDACYYSRFSLRYYL